MRTHCCYRLTPAGEIIHSEYDYDIQNVIGMPEGVLDDVLNLEKFSMTCYVGCDVRFDVMCEEILAYTPENFLVIEYGNQGYYAITFAGESRYFSDLIDWDEVQVYLVDKPAWGNYIPIGIRKTVPMQYRTTSGLYLLTADKDLKYVYTNDGIFEIDFDTTGITQKFKPGYAGYQDMVTNGYYAIVYTDTEVKFLDIKNGKLVQVDSRRV